MSEVLLHTADGRVWIAGPGASVIDTKLVPNEIGQWARERGRLDIRVMGTAENAALICRLYALKTEGRLQSVRVCTPLAATTAAERRGVSGVFECMRQMALPASLGGFHEVTHHDNISYQLAIAVQENSPDSWFCHLLTEHAVWPALQFCKRLIHLACARVLGILIDPRWYVDTRAPMRLSRMQKFMGLEPRIQRRVSCSESPTAGVDLHTCRQILRCQLMRACWHTPQLAKQATDAFTAYQGYEAIADDVVGLASGDFVWRTWGRCRQPRKAGTVDCRTAAKADLRASQQLLTFLRSAWLDAIYRDSPAVSSGDRLFDPAEFFKTPIERAAFKQHAAAVGL